MSFSLFFQYHKRWNDLCQNYYLSRQIIIIQISLVIKRKMKQEESNDAIDPRKDQIYESAEMESEFDKPKNNQIGAGSKKQTKLLRFLGEFTEQFTKQLFNFLLANKDEYQSRPPPKVICLYEDVLYMYEFKNAEDKLLVNKKGAMQQLCKELGDKTHKKPLTIKERMQKKLANLEIKDIRQFISLKRDIAFNEKKQLSKPKIVNAANPKSIFSNEQINNASHFKQQPGTNDRNEGPKQEVVAQNEPSVALDKKLTKIAEEGIKKSLFSNNSVYKYGTKPVKEAIKILFDPVSKKLVPFKMSKLATFVDKTDSLNEVKDKSQQPTLVDGANNESAVAEDSKKTIKNQSIFMNLIQRLASQDKLEKQPKEYLTYINKIREQTLNTLCNLQNKSSSQNSAEIQELQETLNKVQELRNVMLESKSVQEKSVTPEPRIETSTEQREKSESGKGMQATTGKKIFYEDESSIQNVEMSPATQEAQLKQLKRMLCNNQHYFKILSEDSKKGHMYLWYAEEDKLLQSFKFSPSKYGPEMLCMLRHKNMKLVLERLQFLGLMDARYKQSLDSLTTKNEVNHQSKVEAMQVQQQ